MRIRTIVTSLALVVLMTSLAMSQSLVRESFSYPATIAGLGTAVDGWGGSWAVDPSDNGVEGLAIIATNVFDYDDFNWVLPDTGNHVQVTTKNAWGDHQRYKRPLAQNWANTAGEQLWVSYMLDVKEPLPLGNTYFMVKLYDNTDEIMAIGKGGGRDNNPPVYTCGSGWPGNEGDDVSEVEIVGGPVWLVVRVDMSGNPGGDSRTFMWVDPDPTAEPDTTTADVKRNSNMYTGVNYVGLEYGGDNAGGQLIFDEIRLASSYADLSSPITSVRLVDNLPYQFALSQNYPNPFNPVTNISYTLKSNGKVHLSVYDIRGRELAVLVDGVQNAGSHTVMFSAADLPSGVYFYRLQTANEVSAKKMTLIK